MRAILGCGPMGECQIAVRRARPLAACSRRGAVRHATCFLHSLFFVLRHMCGVGWYRVGRLRAAAPTRQLRWHAQQTFNAVVREASAEEAG